MGVTYTYDPVRNRLHTVCAGDVGLVDVVNHFHLLSLDRRVRHGADVLLDFSALTSAPEDEQIPTLKESLTRTAAHRPFGRCAAVAAGPPGLHVANRFTLETAAQFSATKVFAELAAATAWLDDGKAPL
jgi:hypothetical protein